jgi:hypothetical protein
MEMLRYALLAISVTGVLSGCGTDAAVPPPEPNISNPSGSATTQPHPPTLPTTATAPTEDGAKAFVAYYTKLVDYTEQTLDTKPIEHISSPACGGCTSGVQAIKRISKEGGRIDGGSETLLSVQSEHYAEGHSISLKFTVRTRAERVIIPGKKTVLHPAGTNTMLITLLPRPTGWIVGELRSA